MNRRGFAVVKIFIVAFVMVAFSWLFASAAGKPEAPKGIKVMAVDNGAVDNTLRKRR